MALYRLGATAGLALALAALAGGANAAVSVMGSGLANVCSSAALSGDDDAKAVETCTLALETEALTGIDKAGTYVNRGVIQLRRKEWVAARSDFDAAIREEPGLGEAYVNRGASFLAQRRFSEALADIDRGIALGPEEPEKAYYNRALVYEGLDDMKQAYLDYMKALEINPNFEEPKRELARFTVSTAP